jgi:hypothetical protein
MGQAVQREGLSVRGFASITIEGVAGMVFAFAAVLERVINGEPAAGFFASESPRYQARPHLHLAIGDWCGSPSINAKTVLQEFRSRLVAESQLHSVIVHRDWLERVLRWDIPVFQLVVDSDRDQASNNNNGNSQLCIASFIFNMVRPRGTPSL